MGEVISELVSSIFSVFGELLLVILIAVLTTGLKELKAIKSENRVRKVVSESVDALNQKLGRDYKSENGTGKLTQDQRDEIFNKCKDTILSIISKSDYKALSKKYGSVGVLLETLIESAIEEKKVANKKPTEELTLAGSEAVNASIEETSESRKGENSNDSSVG